MLKSLIAQTYPHWTALVVPTDRKPMTGLYTLLSQLDDNRLRVIEFPGGVDFKLGSFDVTDKVIDQCPPDSDWLLTTNGDNWYDPAFLDHIDLSRDIIAYDFYSRYVHVMDQDVFGRDCARFFSHAGVMCKKNLLRHWHTDLGSNVINLKRWRVEGRAFTPFEISGDGSADGHAMESLTYYDWSVKLVGGEDGCLFGHAPNIHICLTFSETALWVESEFRCVLDPAEQARLLNQTHHRYFADELHSGLEDFQGRCLDLNRNNK
jgi:hypothetical protein